MSRSSILFIIFALLWQIAVGIIYGLFLGYDEASFTQMNLVPGLYYYSQPSTTPRNVPFLASTSAFPFPQAVIAFAIVLLIVGFALVAGYIEKQVVTGMAFTLLIFAFTVQNFFIFRDFWNRCGVNNQRAQFDGVRYDRINYINWGNDFQSSKELPSASFFDALGAALAMYAGYSAVIGRIGLGEVFFLTWIGTFIYEVNSQLLIRYNITDNGYPSRAFAFGGALGITSSLLLGKKDLTEKNPNFRSSYRVMGMSLLGIILVWCVFPVLGLSDVYVNGFGKVVSMAAQVNIWLALAASVLGAYTASSFIYRKFSVHDIVFSAITGGIAYSSSSVINYNPGAALAIGYGTGLICSVLNALLKRPINLTGVIDSNSSLFHFLIPSFIAAICSAVLQAVGQGQTSLTYNFISPVLGGIGQQTVSYSPNRTRSNISQGGFQIAGWCLSVAFGIGAGLFIGLLYKCINDFVEKRQFFNDAVLFEHPTKNKYEQKRDQGESGRGLKNAKVK